MRWKCKVEEQKNQIAKEEYLYEQRRTAMEQFKQHYMKSMQKEWTRFEGCSHAFYLQIITIMFDPKYNVSVVLHIIKIIKLK